MMKKIFCTLLLFLSLLTLHSQNTSHETYRRHWESGYETVRIISYNIFNGFNWGKDTDRQTRFVQWIQKQDPEILALQELCGFSQESLSALAQQWGHPYAAIVQADGYPVGITSKKPIQVVCKIQENCGHGLLHIKTYGYDILVTHLNPSSTDTRRMEAATIVRYIKEHALDKCLLMGDMNAHSPYDADYMETHATDLLLKYGGNASRNLLNGAFDYSVISTFLSAPLVDVCRSFTESHERMTFPTSILMTVSQHYQMHKKVGERLDYIFATPSVFKDVVDAFIYNGTENDYLSDHYPVAVDLLIKQPHNTSE